MRGPCLSEAQADSLDTLCKPVNVQLHAQGKRRHNVAEPSVVLSGPWLPVLLAEEQFSAHHPLGIGHRYT